MILRIMNTILNLIRQIYPIRTCNYALSEKNITKKPKDNIAPVLIIAFPVVNSVFEIDFK